MKKYFLIIFFYISLLSCLDAQPPTLSYRIVDPQIYFSNPINYLKFTIQVKATQAGTYLYSGQVNFSYSISGFGTSTTGIAVATRSGVSAGMDPYENEKYNIQANLNANILNVYINTTKYNYPAGGGPLSNWFNQIAVDYQNFAIIYLQIDDASQQAGMNFIHSSMNGQQFYQNPSPPYGYLPYTNPNIYDEEKSFRHLNLDRIFSTPAGWTQYGGTVDMGASVNTSVWDSIATIDGSAMTNKLRIHKTAQLVLNPGAQVYCLDSVEINNAHGLWIRSTNSSTGSFIDNGIISCSDSGSALVERYVSQDMWHGYCLPVDSSKTQPFLDRQMLARWYDEPGHKYHTIVNPAGDSLLDRHMLGYLVFSNSALTPNSTLSVSGTPNTGAFSIPVTSTAAGTDGQDGWNLVGNPYPSAVLWQSMILSNVDPVMYIFDAQRGNYIFWNSNDETHTENISSIIPASQGFYVHCNSPVTGMGSVAVNNSARLHDNHSIHKSTLVQDNLLVLTASGNGFRDEAQIWFNESSTLAFDPDHDVYKLWGDSMAPQLYSELPDSTLASLNVLPWTGSNMMVRMGYRNEVEGTFTIAARNMQSFSGSVPIWIEDLQESRLQDLREDSVYSFNSAPSDNSDRFRIYFRDPATGIHGESLPGIEIYSYDKVVYVRRNGGSQLQGNLLLYDMTGRKVFSGKLKDTGLNLFYPDVIQACYIAKVITETNTFTQKVFLK